MRDPQAIAKVETLVKEKLGSDTTGHDWWHIVRVRKTALDIQETEGGDAFVIELAALLHDISDHKFNGGDHNKGSNLAQQFLLEMGMSADIAEHVGRIIERISYSSNNGPMETLEGKIVQDADRIDALGAIGIARCFATSCKLGQVIFNPDDPKGKHAIGHFYEKLLRLKEKMNTATGREIAEERHVFLTNFLEQFLREAK
jgi:uncharacterized protein